MCLVVQWARGLGAEAQGCAHVPRGASLRFDDIFGLTKTSKTTPGGAIKVMHRVQRGTNLC